LNHVAAHARLMFRNEVTQLDAITAILCIESSMTTSAIVDSVGNALHSNFAENPDQECILSSYLCVHNQAYSHACTNSQQLCMPVNMKT
jgi:DNA helicase MCM9